MTTSTDPFWWKWPSWLVELASGLLLTASLALTVFIVERWPTFLVRVAVCTVFSLLYERLLDPNKWNLKDVLQRMVGIVPAVFVWGLIQ